ncbi:MAG: universal stress protein [Aquificaceae bacterium]|nr:universal stress protein [Aquificaceae bacterium]MDW8236848.1 universal stress protein [Aquificaceae bacterium]
MISKLLVIFADEDKSYGDYVSFLIRKFERPALFYCLKDRAIFSGLNCEELIDSLKSEGFIVDLEEGDIETLSDLLRDGFELFIIKYSKKLFGKTIYERLVDSLEGVWFWIYKDSPLIIEKACVPIDFSERSKRQVEVAKNLSEIFGFELELVHALNIERFKEKMEDVEYQKLLNDKTQEAKTLFSDMFYEEFKLKLVEGDPYKGLIKFINSGNYHLVIAGRRSREVRERFGSVSLQIVRSANCPTLVL